MKRVYSLIGGATGPWGGGEGQGRCCVGRRDTRNKVKIIKKRPAGR